MSPPLYQSVSFPVLPSAPYSVLCIIDSIFPFTLLLLDSSLVLLPITKLSLLHGTKRVTGNLTLPGLYFIAWSLIHFWKSSPIQSLTCTENKMGKKKRVACLFQVSVLVRQREMTGGEYSPSVLPVQETWGSLEEGTVEERVFVCPWRRLSCFGLDMNGITQLDYRDLWKIHCYPLVNNCH